jgi:large subunit ribosomal protein L14e
MKAIDVGSVCIKTTGREAGEKAVVLEILGPTMVTIIGPKVRKRKCNILHLLPTGKKIEVNSKITQKEVAKMIE